MQSVPVLEQQPNLKSTFKGVGGFKGLLSNHQKALGASPAALHMGGPHWGSLSYHFQQVWTLLLPQRNISRPFKILFIHWSREKGRAGH